MGQSIYMNNDELKFLYGQLLNMDDDLEEFQKPRDTLFDKVDKACQKNRETK